MLPEPEYMKELMDDLHQEATPNQKGSFPEYQTQHFRLYQFRFIWFSSTEPEFNNLSISLEAQVKPADYILRPNESVISTNSDGQDKEEPTDEELRFLKNTTEKLKEWLEEYTSKKMEKRTCYTQEFAYQDIRVLMLAEGTQLIKKIEKKLDKTRKGYELYTVVGMRKVNDERLLITLERDFIAE
ncbi:19810_t:CDS:2 [Entrophospora sp. SA101]|nr:14676_t:CDS:2 [Entrophospora sp. SA101]CAJ0747284.1 19810_t:CDS:2 [Entrophospora sp. SA101]CAJ0890675.1 2746_t:CDS:2 [Entrophospora sp. SA101]